LGTGSLDAVNKSSISWACGQRAEIEEPDLNRTKTNPQTEEKNPGNLKQKLEEKKEKLEEMGLYEELMELVDKSLTNVENKLKNLEDVKDVLNTFEFRLSLLIATGTGAAQELKAERPSTSHCDEYYAYIGGEVTDALFGTPFMTLLEVVQH
jgi:hypothetical protein